MGKVLVVTFDGGGNVPPALGLAAELRSRGHAVTVLGHPGQRAAIEAAGVSPLEYGRVPTWDPTRERGTVAFSFTYLRLFTHAGFGRDVHDAIERLRPDAVVVDALLPSAMAAAEASGRPTIVLVHTVLAAVRGMARGPVGMVAAAKGFPFGRSLAAADALVIASPEVLATVPAPPRGHYVGPVYGPANAPPAAADPASRRVLVSLSTVSYPGMRGALQSLVDAVGEIGADAVVTTGPAIDPRDVDAPPNVEVLRSARHSELLRDCGLVIGHGGHGTAVRALTAGVPVLVRPLVSTGDHPFVGAGLAHAGVGGRLHGHTSRAKLAGRIRSALDDAALRARARELGGRLRRLDGATAVADVVERVSSGAAEPPPAAARVRGS